MNPTFPSARRLSSCLPLGVALLATFPGCGGEMPEGLPTEPVQQTPGARAVGEYLLHVQPRAGKVTMHRLSASTVAAEARAPGLTPQTLIDANIGNDGVTGSNSGSTTNSTVELVTGNIIDTYGTGTSGGCATNSFCADVTLNSFWVSPLNFTYAQVTSIVDATGTPLSGHSGTNSDAPGRSTLSAASLGLWQYETASVTAANHVSSGSTGVMLNGVANGATRMWQFANRDDADTYVRIKVWGSTAPTNYTFGTRTGSYNSACTISAGDTQLPMRNIFTNTTATPQVQPYLLNAPFAVVNPFAFSYFGTTYAAGTDVNFSKWGQVTFGTATTGSANLPYNQSTMTQTAADTNVALPSVAAAPRPALFPWWDTMRFGGTGAGLCSKVSGTSPNRQLHLSWSLVGFSGSGPYISMSVTLNESTSEIWFNYGPSTGTQAWTATVGAQNDTGTTSVPGSSGSFVTTYAANTTKVLLPAP